MTQKKPAPRKDIAQFLLVNFWIVEDPPANQTVIGVDESADVGDHGSVSLEHERGQPRVLHEARQNRFQPALSG